MMIRRARFLPRLPLFHPLFLLGAWLLIRPRPEREDRPRGGGLLTFLLILLIIHPFFFR